jgi:molybdopterin-guanine dinucleotide biosynthesis protein A
MRADVSALILAGGKASRLGGIAKHELVIGGESILARQRRVLAPRVAEILVSLGSPAAPELSDSHDGHRTVTDAVDGAGPLAGIAAGLAAVATPWLLVVAGDMPDLHGPSIDLILDAARDGLDAVGVRIGGLPEPLVCVLHVRAKAVVDRRLAAGRFKASGLFTDEDLQIAWVHERELRALDPELRGFRNINSPADLRE